MRRPTWLITGCLAAVVLLAACGGQVAAPAAVPKPTVAPSPTTAPTVAPTAVPTVAPSPTTAPAAARRPAGMATVPARPAQSTTDTSSPMGEGFLSAFNLASMGSLKPAAGGRSPASELARTTEQALAKVTSYRMQGAISSKKEGKIDLLMEYVAPDMMRFLVTLDAATAAQQPRQPQRPEINIERFEVVLIGSTAYFNMGGDWLTSEGDATSISSEDMSQLLVEVLDTPGITKQGHETLDGEPCDIYVYTEDGVTARMWVSSRDQFFRKIEGGDDDVQVLITVTGINEPFEIKAPI